ncbi:MAG: ABC-2 family transporter protein [Oscillospiraceae bacterium]|nr:ABC-2 family transporter protein [Oscillospiraceae bacterium]
MRLYLKYCLINMKSQMQYKLSFFLVILGQFLSAFTVFFSVFFMFSIFNAVDGFTYGQVLLCFAIVGMAFSIAELVSSGFAVFSFMLGSGTFDRILVRPQGAVFQVLASRMDLSRLGITVQSIIILCWAVPNSGVNWTWDKISTLCLMIICGSVIFSCLFLIQASFAFFTTEGLEFMNALTYGGREHGRYPFSIYGRGVLSFLTYVIPLALFQYYPLLYLIGRASSMWYMFTPVLGLLFLIPSYAFFRFGLSRYKSTGS